LRIDDLARVAGMSASSFHRHFQAVTSMTPIQYQKQIRLQTARTLLMSVSRLVSRWATRARRNSAVNIAGSSAMPGKDRKRLRAMSEVG
jgi:transcriptional regulator GlxA family with amidase domain